MAGAYQGAHLIIARAGATTLAELMVHHKASILIPFPLAADHHQHLNARILADHKAAEMIDPDHLTGRHLARLILHLYNHPAQRAAMEKNAGSLGKPQAAQAIVDHCYKLVA
jgi:UDP-N-acetylglucosamine--N-acetylmuramyl-(pentapeptide) pyrophosphoryl-undecaprenol N-acetylglucosamine transferase